MPALLGNPGLRRHLFRAPSAADGLADPASRLALRFEPQSSWTGRERTVTASAVLSAKASATQRRTSSGWLVLYDRPLEKYAYDNAGDLKAMALLEKGSERLTLILE